MKDIVLYVKGMDCEEEARLVRGALDGLRGVDHYEINLVAGKVRVSYDPSLLAAGDVVAAVERTGMEAGLEKEPEEGPKVWWMEPRILTLSACAVLIATNLILEHIFGLSHAIARFIYGAAVVVGGYFPAKMGIMALRRLAPNIRTLMVAGAAGAIYLGLWEEAALLVFIYSLGDMLEAYAADRVRGAVRALMGLAPKEAQVKRDGKILTLPLDAIRVGDTIVIRPGERIALDGEVLSGSSSVDQSPITGESIPVKKGTGDEVFAGSINQRGSLEVRVTKPFEDTTLGRILHHVEEAGSRKSSYQRFGETFGRYYTPAMFLLAIGVMAGPALVFGGWRESFYRGLVVLVVSCSCGIALSIPVAVVAAVANAARHGVLIKGGAHIEAASGLKAMAFDKTGSLTMGRPVVTDIVPFGGRSKKDVLAVAASMESRSEHVLADAILAEAEKQGLTVEDVESFEIVPGMGARAVVRGRPYCIGNIAMCGAGVITEDARHSIERLEKEGKTLILLTDDGELAGLIAVRDEIRPEARKAVERLRELGITGIVMLTGDNETVASVIAGKAGIDEYMAGLLPEDKVSAVDSLKARYGNVAMVGDGVNDAPAMVASDLGIAMGAAGTDVAIETGDVVLMSDDLSRIPYVVALSRKAVRNIRENIAISLVIIAFLVPVALLGRIDLVPGLLVNEVGGLLVIMNGLRLLGWKSKE